MVIEEKQGYAKMNLRRQGIWVAILGGVWYDKKQETDLVRKDRRPKLQLHEILKKRITDYEERIFDGYGHGQKMIRDTADYLSEIRKALS